MKSVSLSLMQCARACTYQAAIALVLFFQLAHTAHAQQINPPLTGVRSLQEFVEEILAVVVQIGFPIIILALVYTGFLFVKAQGNPQELERAKTALLWTIVGAFVLLGAQVLAMAIGATIDQLGGPTA